MGCDQGEPKLEPALAPPLHIVAIYPPPNAGLDCPPAEDGGVTDCGVPRNAIFELRFDRYLAPATAIRQSIRVFAGTPDTSVFFQPQYDVIERVVSFVPTAPMAANLLHTLEIVTKRDGGSDGFRSFDGADLEEEGSVPLRFNFRTSATSETRPETPAPSCQSILDDVFGTRSCARGSCHSPIGQADCPAGYAREPFEPGSPCVGVPRMGLDLSGAPGLVTTAINRVAHQSEIGPQGGRYLENPARFGVQMPLIEPGNPGNSYLLYKLLMRPQNYAGIGSSDVCVTDHRVPLPDGQCLPPSEAEMNRVRDWFLRGQPMPLRADLPMNRPMLVDLQRWIAAGAHCP